MIAPIGGVRAGENVCKSWRRLLAGLSILLLVAVMLCCFRLNIDCRLKQPDGNMMRPFAFATLRCSLCAFTTHVPIWSLQTVQWTAAEELLLRVLLAFALAIAQPIGCALILPEYSASIRAIFSKYTRNTKR